MSFKNVQVLVLAGQRKGHADPLCEAFDVPFKVETPILDRPMLSWVEESLDKAGLNRPFLISGYAPQNEGWLQVTAGNGPADSALIALSDAKFPCLITTGDHPLLLPEMINEFISLALKSKADFCVGLATEDVVSAAHPTTKRTYLRFSDRAVSGCNLFFVRNKEGLAALEFWKEAQHLRKQPLKLARKIGLGLGVRFAAGRLSLDQAFNEAGEKIGIKAAPVLLSDGEAAIDVDKPADQVLVENILRGRLSTQAV